MLAQKPPSSLTLQTGTPTDGLQVKDRLSFNEFTTGTDGLHGLARERERPPRAWTGSKGSRQRLVSFLHRSGIPPHPRFPIRRDTLRLETSQDFGLWNERAGQCQAFARTDPLIRVIRVKETNFGLQPIRGLPVAARSGIRPTYKRGSQ
jgi:hypothetical protein